MISEATRRLLIASKVRGVGKKTLRDLANERLFFELPPEKWNLGFPEFARFEEGSEAYDKAFLAAEAQIEEAKRLGVCILSIRDASFPQLLRPANDGPTILYVLGNPLLATDRAVAVIGTREPSDHGSIVAQRITTYFANNAWQIVSGLAIGIDTVAHESALSCGASTVAVLAHGLETVYPKQNAKLAERILKMNGLLVSEYPIGTPSFPSNFVERDRIQAALARGVVMVQSDVHGGSLHASRSALAYDRLLVVPAPTQQDLAARHPKAKANEVLADGEIARKLEVLRCEASKLSSLVVLRSKADYPGVERRLLEMQVSNARPRPASEGNPSGK